MLLIVIEVHSKWMKARIVGPARAEGTVESLRSMFATHGLPEQMVTDNGLVFTIQEFKEFMQSNSIDHIRVSPCHPLSDGLTERAVQLLNLGRAKMKDGTLAVVWPWYCSGIEFHPFQQE